jgi:hypothetical protein
MRQVAAKLVLHKPLTSRTLLPIIKRFSPISLTKDDIVKSLAQENGYPFNQTVELTKTLLEIIKILTLRCRFIC